MEPDSSSKTDSWNQTPPRNPRISASQNALRLSSHRWPDWHDIADRDQVADASNVPLFILDYNGTLLSSTLPREPVNGPLKIAQVEAYKDAARRFYIAKKLVEAKAQRTLDVMKWLAARYGELRLKFRLTSRMNWNAWNSVRACRVC